MKKKGMSGSGKVMTAIGSVLLVLAVAVVAVANFFAGVLDTYVGMGKPKVVTKPGSENWDTEYYSPDKTDPEGVDEIAKDVTRRIAEEGITLMKNNGILPLKGNESVSLFGRRSVDTAWGGTGSGAGDEGQCTPMAQALGDQGFDFATDLKGSISSGETAMSKDVAETQNYENGQHQLEMTYEEEELLKHVSLTEEDITKIRELDRGDTLFPWTKAF